MELHVERLEVARGRASGDVVIGGWRRFDSRTDRWRRGGAVGAGGRRSARGGIPLGRPRPPFPDQKPPEFHGDRQGEPQQQRALQDEDAHGEGDVQDAVRAGRQVRRERQQTRVEGDGEHPERPRLQPIRHGRLKGLVPVLQRQARRERPHRAVDPQPLVRHERHGGDDEGLAGHVEDLPVPALPPEPRHYERERLLLQAPPDLAEEVPPGEEGGGHPQPVADHEEAAHRPQAPVPGAVAVHRVVRGKEPAHVVPLPRLRPGGDRRAEVVPGALLDPHVLQHEGGVEEVQGHAERQQEDAEDPAAAREAPAPGLGALGRVHGREPQGVHAADGAVVPEHEQRQGHPQHRDPHVAVEQRVGVDGREQARDAGGRQLEARGPLERPERAPDRGLGEDRVEDAEGLGVGDRDLEHDRDRVLPRGRVGAERLEGDHREDRVEAEEGRDHGEGRRRGARRARRPGVARPADGAEGAGEPGGAGGVGDPREAGGAGGPHDIGAGEEVQRPGRPPAVGLRHQYVGPVADGPVGARAARGLPRDEEAVPRARLGPDGARRDVGQRQPASRQREEQPVRDAVRRGDRDAPEPERPLDEECLCRRPRGRGRSHVGVHGQGSGRGAQHRICSPIPQLQHRLVHQRPRAVGLGGWLPQNVQRHGVPFHDVDRHRGLRAPQRGGHAQLILPHLRPPQREPRESDPPVLKPRHVPGNRQHGAARARADLAAGGVPPPVVPQDAVAPAIAGVDRDVADGRGRRGLYSEGGAAGLQGHWGTHDGVRDEAFGEGLAIHRHLQNAGERERPLHDGLPAPDLGAREVLHMPRAVDRGGGPLCGRKPAPHLRRPEEPVALDPHPLGLAVVPARRRHAEDGWGRGPAQAHTVVGWQPRRKPQLHRLRLAVVRSRVRRRRVARRGARGEHRGGGLRPVGKHARGIAEVREALPGDMHPRPALRIRQQGVDARHGVHEKRDEEGLGIEAAEGVQPPQGGVGVQAVHRLVVPPTGAQPQQSVQQQCRPVELVDHRGQRARAHRHEQRPSHGIHRQSRHPGPGPHPLHRHAAVHTARRGVHLGDDQTASLLEGHVKAPRGAGGCRSGTQARGWRGAHRKGQPGPEGDGGAGQRQWDQRELPHIAVGAREEEARRPPCGPVQREAADGVELQLGGGEHVAVDEGSVAGPHGDARDAAAEQENVHEGVQLERLHGPAGRGHGSVRRSGEGPHGPLPGPLHWDRAQHRRLRPTADRVHAHVHLVGPHHHQHHRVRGDEPGPHSPVERQRRGGAAVVAVEHQQRRAPGVQQAPRRVRHHRTHPGRHQERLARPGDPHIPGLAGRLQVPLGARPALRPAPEPPPLVPEALAHAVEPPAPAVAVAGAGLGAEQAPVPHEALGARRPGPVPPPIVPEALALPRAGVALRVGLRVRRAPEAGGRVAVHRAVGGVPPRVARAGPVRGVAVPAHPVPVAAGLRGPRAHGAAVGGAVPRQTDADGPRGAAVHALPVTARPEVPVRARVARRASPVPPGRVTDAHALRTGLDAPPVPTAAAGVLRSGAGAQHRAALPRKPQVARACPVPRGRVVAAPMPAANPALGEGARRAAVRPGKARVARAGPRGGVAHAQAGARRRRPPWALHAAALTGVPGVTVAQPVPVHRLRTQAVPAADRRARPRGAACGAPRLRPAGLAGEGRARLNPRDLAGVPADAGPARAAVTHPIHAAVPRARLRTRPRRTP